MKRLILTGYASLLAFGQAVPSVAQETAEDASEIAAEVAQAESNYDLLVVTLSPDALHEVTYMNTVEQLRAFYLENPSIASLEKQCPGLVDATFAQAEPEMRDYHFAEAEEVRRVLREVFEENLTPEEALQVAALFGSPLGQKIVMNAGQNQDFRNTMESSVRNEGGAIDRESFERDTSSTTSKVIQTLTAEELRDFGLLVMKNPVFLKFRALNPMIQQRRFELLNSDRLQEERIRMEQALQAGIKAHLETCE